MILHVLIARVAGWIQQHQQQVITYLIEENRILKGQLGGRRLRLTDTERRRLAALAHPLGRKRLKEIATTAPRTPSCAGIAASSRRSLTGAHTTGSLVGHR